MKKYILKRDLPTFKAGDTFVISKAGNLVKYSGCISNCVVAYKARTLKKFPNILTDWFEEIPKRPKTVWDLNRGDTFYVIEDGKVAGGVWNGYDYVANRDAGDVFLTVVEAKKELARRKAKQILLRDTKGFKPDWHSDSYDKYEVVYEYSNDYYNGYGLYVNDCNHCCTHYDLWFATKEDAKASIKAHEKEWKIYLGVEDD